MASSACHIRPITDESWNGIRGMRHYKFTFAVVKIGDGSVLIWKNTFVLLYCSVWEILQEESSRKAISSGRGTFRSENKKAHLCRNDGDLIKEKSPVQRPAVCHENQTARGGYQTVQPKKLFCLLQKYRLNMHNNRNRRKYSEKQKDQTVGTFRSYYGADGLFRCNG